MSRYIDADTIEPLLKEERDFHKKMYDNMQQPCEHDDKQIVGAYYTAYSKSYHAVKDAPTVDAVPVVRCRECEHRKPPTDYCEILCKAYMPDEFYCGCGKRIDGERKDGETEHGNTYSLGKIEMPKGAMKKIIADVERKDGEG